MSKADLKVSELVAKVERGELQLPEMQREYVWRATRVRDLFDSLYRGYPSGVILAWESDEQVATRSFAIETEQKPSIRPLLLLDGQQRITSLSAVLRGKPVSVRGNKKPVEILFNLDHPEKLMHVTDIFENEDGDELENDEVIELGIQEHFKRMTFVVSSKALDSMLNWVRVTDIFTKPDTELLQNAGILTFTDPRFEKYSSRIKAVRAIADYQYRMDILERDKSYEEVTEIFVRVNSLGVKLRSSDLALAQITAKWKGSLALFRGYQDKVSTLGFDFELGTYLKTMMAIITGQSKFLTVNSIPLKDLESGWTESKKALDFAFNFIRANLGIDSPTLLSSPFLVVTTAFWAHKNEFKVSGVDEASFKKWFLVANAKGRYSRGSSESLLDQDLVVIRNGGTGEELMVRLEQQVGRLSFTPEELVGRSSRSGAFKCLFLAFKSDKAKDWSTNLEISAKHQGKSDAIEYHHIFPKAYLKRLRPDIDRTLVNDIANLAFIGSTTNKKISDRSPEEYKSKFLQDVLDVQLIDFTNERDNPENFEYFISERRKAIALRLNEFLKLS